MLNVASLIIGVIALICVVIAFIPFLGLLNWFIIPLAVIGAAVGMAARSKAGRNLNIFVIIVGVIRLSLGGGII